MKITTSPANCTGIRFAVKEDSQEIGRAFLYIMYNDLHQEPFGLIEDVFIDQEYRQKGIGKKLINKVIAAARKQGCYKIIATSRHTRPLVHDFYAKLGFEEHGGEYRINL